MDVLINILFWIHLLALAAGGVAVFGIPIVGSRMASAPPEARPVLGSVVDMFSRLGRGAFGALIITGPLVLWLKYDGTGGMTGWFWLKMLFVLALLGLIIWSGLNRKRLLAGDAAAIQLAPRLGMASMIVYLLLILSAVFAFN